MSKHHPAGHVICDTGRYLVVSVGGGAQMSCPTPDLEWQLRYGDRADAGLTAASVADSFAYLITECNKDEAWRRIKIMREAMRNAEKKTA